MYDNCEEKELVVKAQAGDRGAQELLCEQYYPKVLRLSLMFLREWHAAHDVAQDVFCRVFAEGQIKYFRARSSLAFWLLAITRNYCYSHLRKRKYRIRLGLCAAPTAMEMSLLRSKDLNPEDQCLHAEEAFWADGALRQIPKMFSKCLEYWYFREYSYKEAAKRLRISVKLFGLRKLRAERLMQKKYALWARGTKRPR
ncbi:RNA polymerase sigma factor [candidate division FCPU426 bacterium]|nr:RNA polymerase sigma factor [candidate division FCPU426 bacterium]